MTVPIKKMKKMKKMKKTKKIKAKSNTKTKKGRIPLTIKQQMKEYNENESLRCSPNPNNKNKKFSCLEDEAIYKLRDLWNARHHDLQINSNDSREIWEKLNFYMGKTCKKESCWLKQKFVGGKMNDALTDSFAPEIPSEWKKNPNDWLSSLDILNVMNQYEKAYKCFEFMGPSPIDFDTHKLHGDCVWEELCHFSLDNEIDKEKKSKIGIVFNMDTHDKPGSHWTSMFINIKRGTIFYFDSAGNRIPKKIKALVDRIISQGNARKPKIKFTFDQNYPVEHQYGDSTCGIYALYFIAHLLEDRHTEDYFKTHILTDEYIDQFRTIYFNKTL
jgi:hypothetical protein